MIKKFLYFFNNKQKKSLLVFFCFMIISSTLEIVGLGFIFVIIGSLNSANAQTNLFVKEKYQNTFSKKDLKAT